MLPQALLFSSDQQVAELVLALLPEFGIEVEHRGDVFSAIEKLTGRPYHVLVVDWKEQLEASFLLKTARELTLAKSTPAVAIVEQRDVSAALKLGANAVLIKPLVYEQARSTFAACLPGISAEQPSASQTSARQVPPPPTTEYRSAPAPKPRFTEASPASPTRRSIAKPPTFAGYSERPSGFRLSRVFKPFLALVAIAGGGLAAPHYQDIASRVRTTSQSWLQSRSRSQNQAAPVEERPEQAIAFENPSLGKDLDYPTADPASVSRQASAPDMARSPFVRASNTRSDTGLSGVIDQDASALHPDVPNSLMVPLQAITGRPAETKLSQQPNRWSLEPTLLPEEAARQMIVRQVSPKYPEFAIAAGMEGVVTLHAFVGKDGVIRDLKLIRGSLLLGRSAFDAVKQWRYKPYRVNGEAVEMQTFITVSFVRMPHAALAKK